VGATLSSISAEIHESIRTSGFSRPLIVGHGLGALAALSEAAEQPQRPGAMVLVCPLPPVGVELPRPLVELCRAADRDPYLLGRLVDLTTQRIPAATRDRLVSAALTLPPGLLTASFDALLAGAPELDVSRVRQPVTVMSADSVLTPVGLVADQLVSRIHGARLETMPGVGHYLMLEAPEQVAATVRAAFGGSP
jgi:pimeloyl-ACP methyl ester carboxylesterase